MGTDVKGQEEQTEEKKIDLPFKENEPQNYNIIDSVKGGCGKSTLSLMLSLAAQWYLYKKIDSLIDDENPIICSMLLDMDMQGSSWQHLLFGRSLPGESGLAKESINKALIESYRCKVPDCLSKPWFLLENALSTKSNSLPLLVALASPDFNEREQFKAASRLNYSSQITYLSFLSGLKKTLKHLKDLTEQKIHYVFFDMPPNSNGYSDSVLEVLLDGKCSSTLDKKSPRNYFEVMTLDRGNIDTTLDWFTHFVNEEPCQFPDHFFFVFTNVPDSIAIMDLNNTLVRDAIDYVSANLPSKLSKKLRGRIFFLGIEYQQEYLHMCCTFNSLGIKVRPTVEGTGLEIEDKKLPVLPDSFLTPVKFAYSLKTGEEVKYGMPSPTDWLLELLRKKGDA